MIKKMRIKFIGITMLSLAIVMSVLILGISGFNMYQINKRADMILNMLSENDGHFPQSMRERKNTHPSGERTGGIQDEISDESPSEKTDIRMNENLNEKFDEIPPQPPEVGASGERPAQPERPDNKNEPKSFRMFEMNILSPETSFETRFFVVRTDNENNITKTDISSVAAIDETDANRYAQEILNKGSVRGYKGNYRYLVSERNDEKMVIFVDRRNQIDTMLKTLFGSCLVALICILVVFVLVFLLSGRVIKPMIESAEKQKQFITDAGHEIKTPLAIISASNDVLEITYGENEWCKSIKNQVRRLDKLVKNLLILSKLDEEKVMQNFGVCSLDTLLSNVISDFASLIEKKNIKLSLDIDKNKEIYADESSIRNLISILMDNAVKYTNDNGNIDVKLTSVGENVVIEMFNSCENTDNIKVDRLFDRFYRADESRSRESGGYGIGLSVASAIMKAHGGRIYAKLKDNGISFFGEFKRIKKV